MAYADRKATGSRTVAGVIVAVIVVAVGWAFYTGLAISFVKKVAPKLNTFDVQTPPPPPPDEPPPPPPPDQPQPPASPPPIVTPPPIVRTPAPAPPVVSVPTAPPITYTPTAPPNPPAPPAPPARPVISQQAKAKSDLGQFFGDDNYPPEARRDNEQGNVSVSITVGPDGRVSDCSVTGSSGHQSLDDATCRIFKRSVRYSPAKDASGQAIASTVRPPRIVWKLTE